MASFMEGIKFVSKAEIDAQKARKKEKEAAAAEKEAEERRQRKLKRQQEGGGEDKWIAQTFLRWYDSDPSGPGNEFFKAIGSNEAAWRLPMTGPTPFSPADRAALDRSGVGDVVRARTAQRKAAEPRGWNAAVTEIMTPSNHLVYLTPKDTLDDARAPAQATGVVV